VFTRNFSRKAHPVEPDTGSLPIKNPALAQTGEDLMLLTLALALLLLGLAALAASRRQRRWSR